MKGDASPMKDWKVKSRDIQNCVSGQNRFQLTSFVETSLSSVHILRMTEGWEGERERNVGRKMGKGEVEAKPALLDRVDSV